MTDLTDREKSVLLAKAAGWRVSKKTKDRYDHWFVIVQEKDDDDWLWIKDARYPFDLYSPANMALAWRVHLWAMPKFWQYWHYWRGSLSARCVWENADAQRLWLDKILSLVIESKTKEIT